MVGVAVWAASFRLNALDSVRLHMDALHPYIGALQITEGIHFPWRGVGSDFRFGALHAWLSVPLVAFADTSEQVLTRNGVLHALGVFPLAWAGWRCSGWGTAFFAGSCYAAWPILVSHPIHGAYSYQAPVFIAFAIAFAVEATLQPNRRWLVATFIALAGAVSLHPIALPIAIGAAISLFLFRTLYQISDIQWAVGAGLVCVSPWLIDNLLLVAERAEAGINATPQDPSMAHQSVVSLMHDALSQTISGWPSWTLVICLLAPLSAAVLLATKPWRGPESSPAQTGSKLFSTWTVLALIGLFLFVGLLDYVQPYHWAVWLPLCFLLMPMNIGLLTRRWLGSKAGPAGILFGLLSSLWMLTTTQGQLVHLTFAGPPNVEQRGVIHAASKAVSEQSQGATRTFAVLTDATGNTRGEPIALFFEQWLSGEGDDNFPTTWKADGPQAFVLASLSTAQWAAWGNPAVPVPWSTPSGPGQQIRLLAFPSTVEAATWLSIGCALKTRWPTLLVQGPQEGLGGLKGARDGADPRLIEWARLCAAE